MITKVIYCFHDGILEEVPEITDNGATYLVVIVEDGIPISSNIVNSK